MIKKHMYFITYSYKIIVNLLNLHDREKKRETIIFLNIYKMFNLLLIAQHRCILLFICCYYFHAA